MTKLQLAQKRNYFKFVLSGMYRQIYTEALTEQEQEAWFGILNLREQLIDNFEDNSRAKGLRVPEHRCWCGKEAKNLLAAHEDGFELWVCNKHKKED